MTNPTNSPYAGPTKVMLGCVVYTRARMFRFIVTWSLELNLGAFGLPTVVSKVQSVLET